MIVIKIHNTEELAHAKTGKLLATVGSLFTDMDKAVNRQVAQQLRVQLAKNRIASDVSCEQQGITVQVKGWKGFFFEKKVAEKIRGQLTSKGVDASVSRVAG